MNSAGGRLVETRRMFHAACAASHQPARNPTRASRTGVPPAGSCADNAGVRSTTADRAARHRCCVVMRVFSGRNEGIWNAGRIDRSPLEKASGRALALATRVLTPGNAPGLTAMKQTAALLVAFVLLGSATARAQHPDLSGHWAWNQGQSDNPRDMMQSRDSSAGERTRGGGGSRGGFGRGRGGRGGFGGGGGAYRGGGGEMSDSQRSRMRQTMDLAF